MLWQCELTLVENLGKTKVYQPQDIPAIAPVILQHHICDSQVQVTHVCPHV